MILHVRHVGLLTGTGVERGVGRNRALAREWLELRVRAGSAHAEQQAQLEKSSVLQFILFFLKKHGPSVPRGRRPRQGRSKVGSEYAELKRN